MIDYPCSNVWNLICEPMEELDAEDAELWGSLEESLLDNFEDEDYE